MSRPPLAWVLNLDAEHEFEARRHYAPTRHLQAIVRRESRRLVGSLVQRHDVVVTQEALLAHPDPGSVARGLPGVAWSPTPSALALLGAAGARPCEAPSLATLRTVNARPFAATVRAPIAQGSLPKTIATNAQEALRTLAGPAADGWLVRRTFGAAGRGRRRMRAGRPSEEELAWLRASLRRGPLVLEPWVRVTREYTRSGWVSPEGQVTIAPPCFQETTESGAWIRTASATLGEIGADDDARLQEALERAGRALADAGYFGPFGIDAFRYRLGARERLNPLSEINARFTMDWPSAQVAATLTPARLVQRT